MNPFDRRVLDKLAEKKNCKNAEGKGDWGEVPKNICFGKKEVEENVALARQEAEKEKEKYRQELLEKIDSLSKLIGVGEDTRGWMLGRVSIFAELRSFLQEKEKGEEK